MAECPPQFPLMSPQVVPFYQTSPTPMPSQPMFSAIPPSFGYPPIVWSPVNHFSSLPPIQQQQPAYSHSEDDQEGTNQSFNGSVNGVPVQHFQLPFHQPQLPLQQPEFLLQQPDLPFQQPDLLFQQQHVPQQQHQMPVYFNNNSVVCDSDVPSNEGQQVFLPPRLMYSSNKFDTKHEEFRKYLEESSIISIFSNILSKMFQDPLRPDEPLKFIQEQLHCSRPETIELLNLRLWCEQYQIKTERLEKELKHVIERLKNHEPYDTDYSFIYECSSVNACKSCVLEVSKQERVLRNIEENHNCESFRNNNQ